MLIKSVYRDTESEQFYCKVVNEDEEYLYVSLLEPYCYSFQEGKSITKLRKSIIYPYVKENYLYKVSNKEYCEQLSLL